MRLHETCNFVGVASISFHYFVAFLDLLTPNSSEVEGLRIQSFVAS